MKNRWLIALCAVGIHICIGSVYAWSMLNQPLMAHFGIPASDIGRVTLAFTIAIFFLGVSAAFLGRFVEARGPRVAGTLAAGLFGIGMIGSGVAVHLGSVPLLYLFYGVIGGMGLGVGYIAPVSTLIKWFPDKRGLATGMAIMGFGFASFIATFAMKALIDAPSADFFAVRSMALSLPGELQTWNEAGGATTDATDATTANIDPQTIAATAAKLTGLLGDADANQKAIATEMKTLNASLKPLAKILKNQPDSLSLSADQSAAIATSLTNLTAAIEEPWAALVAKLSPTIERMFYILGGAYALVMLASASYLAPPPEGYKPPGYDAACTCPRRRKFEPVAQLTANESLRTVRFYLLWTMLFINITCGIGVISVAKNMADNVGLSAALASLTVAGMSVFNGLGRIGWSSASDYLGRPLVWLLFFAIQIVAFLILPAMPAMIFPFVVFLIMTCYGGGFASVPAYISDIFGTKQVSAIHGYILTAWALAGVIGPQLLALLRKWTGGYERPLYVFAGMFVIALVVAIVLAMQVRELREKAHGETTPEEDTLAGEPAIETAG